MKLKTMAAAVAIIGSMLGASAFAQDSDTDRSHPKAFIKDSVITTKVKSKLAADHLSSLAHIRVDTDRDGVVWLSGTAPSREAADRAVSLARDTEGVAKVKSSIEVRRDHD
jgi:hyperosmotically inducible periplasmic protein